jgi:hypothetical protein
VSPHPVDLLTTFSPSGGGRNTKNHENKTSKDRRRDTGSRSSNDSGERVQVRILQSGEYSTGTTSFTFGAGKKVALLKSTARNLAEAGRVQIIG